MLAWGKIQALLSNPYFFTTMISKEDVIKYWQTGVDIENYDNEEILDKVDEYSFTVNRYYDTPIGSFIASGIKCCDKFDLEEVDFDGNDGESYTF